MQALHTHRGLLFRKTTVADCRTKLPDSEITSLNQPSAFTFTHETHIISCDQRATEQSTSKLMGYDPSIEFPLATRLHSCKKAISSILYRSIE